MNLIQELTQKQLISPPKWLPNNTHYLVMMGSVAYGASNDTSDIDVYGFAIPPKEVVFPHLAGEIPGFGRQKKRFEQYQQHHIEDKAAKGGRGKQYDVTVYSIVKYFSLVMENNPNMVDSLFAPSHCIMYSSQIGQMVRENRKLFLHKGAWHKFKGYAYSQLNKMQNKKGQGRRAEWVEKYGFDVKFGYHLVRLLLEVEEILETGNLTLDRNGQLLKAIRNGEWNKEQVINFFHTKEQSLEQLYHESELPHSPNEEAIKALLVRCLEAHYGDLSDAVTIPTQPETTINQLIDVLKSAGYV